MSAYDDKPDAPRCPSCQRYMMKDDEKERLVIFKCCGIERTRFRKEFRQIDNPRNHVHG